MAASLEIKLKQDVLLLKATTTPPNTNLGEAGIFLDAESYQLKVRSENNGEVKNLSSDSQESGGLQNGSVFFSYHSTNQVIPFGQQYNKVQLGSIVTDKLGEFADSKFTAKEAGIYLMSCAASAIIDFARGDWRVIITFYVNGVERSRGNDLIIPILYGGSSGSAILNLNAGDYVELFLYSEYACSLFGGEGITRMSGVRIA